MSAATQEVLGQADAEPVMEVDVVVVGGRVAGCATAIHLRRSGLRVAVVDRDDPQTDVLSTHLVQDLGLFEELGVLQEVLACGAPPLLLNHLHVDGADLSEQHDGSPWLCPRRITLDDVLARAAERAGAVMLRRTSVVGVLRDGERVCGVVVQRRDGGREHVRARFVVGADGRNSTVARLVGAQKYDVVPAERGAVWSYYAGLPLPEAFFFSRRGPDLMLVAPTDSGLALVAAQPPVDDPRDWRDRSVLETVAQDLVGPLRGLLPHAEPACEVRSVRRMEGYLREAAGPGWALTGDAGHFKDVVVGQGICDALRQSRALAACLSRELADPVRLDAALRSWWRERDDIARPMSWLAADLGRVHPSVLDQQLLSVLASAPRHRRHLREVFSRRRHASAVVGTPRRLEAFLRAVIDPEVNAPELRDAVTAAVRRDLARRSTERRPAFMRPGARGVDLLPRTWEQAA